MSAILVDSNVLLDVMTMDAQWAAWSSAALADAAETARLFINPIIYAEVSVRFSRIEDLEAGLPAALLESAPVPYEAAFLAGKLILAYRRRGGVRTAPLTDFFIGAHAAVAGMRLLTRDVARYRADFPTLELIAPEGG
jgi:hypothetical protein